MTTSVYRFSLLSIRCTNINKRTLRNAVVGVLNILSLLLGLAAIGASAYIHICGGSDCQKVLQYPLLIGGVLMVLVSTLGIAGWLYGVDKAIYGYLLVTFLLALGLALFIVFALFVTNMKVGKKISGRGYGEYRVDDFSHWLQRYVVKDKNWNKVKSCLMDARVCDNLALNGGRNNDSLIFKHLSTTQVI